MPQIDTYKNWRAVTEADFVALFIKTWFAYISTLRVIFPEAYNRRGDKKYLNAYKDFYIHNGYKDLIVESNMMGSIEKLYCEGRKIIMRQYPEYYFWDFYHVNENFDFSFKDIPPDKSDCLIVGMKLYRNRGTVHSFIITGFVKFFGKYYGEEYNENIKFSTNISEILKDTELLIKEHADISEQDFLVWVLEKIFDKLQIELFEKIKLLQEQEKYSKRIINKIELIHSRSISIMRSVFSLNSKDETFKNVDEMERARNTYEIIRQMPKNYFQYHMEIAWEPRRQMTSKEEKWFKQLHEDMKKNAIIWFLDFVYRLRNALFHEIIDPLDSEWQLIFKNAYLVLKEIVDLNVKKIETNDKV